MPLSLMALNHFQRRSWAESTGERRFTVSSPVHLGLENVFLCAYCPLESCCWMSVTSSSTSKPLTSESWLMTSPSISMKKWLATKGSSLTTVSAGIVPPYLALSGELLLLADAEYNELRRLHRREPYLHDELALVYRLRRVGLLVAFHVESLVSRAAKKSALSPEPGEETVEGPLDPFPQFHVVGLEHGPLRPVQDGGLHHVEQAPHVEVAPVRARRERPRPPDADAPSPKGPDAVDADRVQHRLLGLGYRVLDVQAATYGLVGRRLPNAPRLVDASPHAGNMPRRRYEHLSVSTVGAHRVLDLYPGVVKGGEGGVVHSHFRTPLLHLLRRHPRRGVQDSHAVAVLFTVGDEGGLHRLPKAEVYGLVRLGRSRYQVRDYHHRHVVGDSEPVDARARRL